jgi:IS5 family transposase
VRVLSRTLKHAQQVLTAGADLAQQVCRDRTRSAKRQMKRIMQTARQRGDEAADRMQAAYQCLVDTGRAIVRQAQRVHQALDTATADGAARVANTLAHFIPLVEQVIAQTTRRVLRGESVPASDKIVSLFEPHTAIIRKGKPGRPTQFGRMVWLDEVEGGLISRYDVLTGNPPDDEQLKPSLDHHRTVFKKPPRLLAGDRGVYSPANERYAEAQGVQHVVLPKPGAKSAIRIAHEQQTWFRRGRNWRSGIEGRISGLKRRHHLDRCRYHGDDGMERWVGWGILAHDLWVIAQATAR